MHVESTEIRRKEHLIIFGILAVSLWATVTNLVPLSIAFAILLPIVPYAITRNRSIPQPVVALLAMDLYFLLSVLTYAPSSLLYPEFYRRDGNVFATFMPVLVGGLIEIPVNIEHLLREFLRWATLVNGVLIAMFMATGATPFLYEPGVYHMLFIAHNAAGGYLAMVTALAIGFYAGGSKRVVSGIFVLVNGLGLLLTVSRGSIVALILAVLLVMVLRERFVKTTIAGLALTLAAILYVTYPVWVSNGGYQNDPGATLGSTGIGARDATILDRVLFLWPRAVDLFFRSPIVGTGFGSYNDMPYHFIGINHFISYNRPERLIFDSAHAHNTYLHVLAETGLLGLGLLVWLLYCIWRAIDAFASDRLRLGLKLGLWTAIFSSMTEHRLFTPAEMLPFTLILGLALARERWYASVPLSVTRQ